jgi:5-methylcytosine-specific restriction endonuclease McrA
MAICPRVGCPEIRPCPIEGHERPKNAPWSKDRDRAQQHNERKATLQRDDYRCTRCGHHDPTGRQLDAHHVSPHHAVTLCNPCHVAIDPSARTRT